MRKKGKEAAIFLRTEGGGVAERIATTARIDGGGGYVFEQDGTSFRIEAKEGRIRIGRRGEINYEVDLRAGEERQFTVGTQYGDLRASARVAEMSVREGDGGLEAECRYFVDFSGSVQEHFVRFRAKPAGLVEREEEKG